MSAGSQGKIKFLFVTLSSEVAIPLRIPPAMNEHPAGPCTGLHWILLVDLGHSGRCAVVSNFCFNLHFPDLFLLMLICHL